MIYSLNEIRIRVEDDCCITGYYRDYMKESIAINTPVTPRPGDVFWMSEEMKQDLKDRMFENWKAYPECITISGNVIEIADRIREDPSFTISQDQFDIEDQILAVLEVVHDFQKGVIWIVTSVDVSTIKQICEDVEAIKDHFKIEDQIF